MTPAVFHPNFGVFPLDQFVRPCWGQPELEP